MPLDTSQLSSDKRIELLEKQMLVMETQLDRIISDIESEKGTRSRASRELSEAVTALDKRLRLVEKSIWIAFGLLLAAQIFLKI